MPDIRFSYYFLPVGQGLFSAGSVYFKADAKAFNWVYDCGTLSTQALIESGIERLKTNLEYPDGLDLVVLSHFDWDHISGVIRLLRAFKVKNLMLPQITLAERMALAMAQNASANPALLAFLADPATYLASLDGINLDRIVFVDRNDGEAGVPLPEGSPRESDDDPFEIAQNSTRDLTSPASGKKMPAVSSLRRGGRIQLKNSWEFVPYHPNPSVRIPHDFSQEVARYEKYLLDPQAKDDLRLTVLGKLRDAYDRVFRKIRRNEISLFLYTGPIDFLRPPGQMFYRDFIVFAEPRNGRILRQDPWFDASEGPIRRSLLYTGDGYLRTDTEFQNLVTHLRTARLERVAVFQVMHHGARRNWQRGLAEKISPLVSVFSSDPGRKNWHHPHAPVLRDFWSFSPVQVDREQGLTAVGSIHLSK